MHSEQAVGKLNYQRKRLSKTTIFFGMVNRFVHPYFKRSTVPEFI